MTNLYNLICAGILLLASIACGGGGSSGSSTPVVTASGDITESTVLTAASNQYRVGDPITVKATFNVDGLSEATPGLRQSSASVIVKYYIGDDEKGQGNNGVEIQLSTTGLSGGSHSITAKLFVNNVEAATMDLGAVTIEENSAPVFSSLSVTDAVSTSGTSISAYLGPITLNVSYTDADNDISSIQVWVSINNGANWSMNGTVSGASGAHSYNLNQDSQFKFVAVDAFGSSDESTVYTINALDEYLVIVIDVSGGASASSYPFSYQYSVPDMTASGNEQYKGDKIVLRKISAGTFTMGSPTDERYREDDEDLHDVTLTQDYYMGVFEVTQAQWENVIGSNPSYFSGNAYRPVEQVRWEYIRGPGASGNAVLATSFMGLLCSKSGINFDLPTEAQWEYACRAGTNSAFNSGNMITSAGQDPVMDTLGRYGRNGGSDYSSDPNNGGSAEVGSYLPNNWSLYDMHGNVWEWCLDWYTYSLGTSPLTDPVGAASGPDHVIRGGGFYFDAQGCRSAVRFGLTPNLSYDFLGFRLALPSVPE